MSYLDRLRKDDRPRPWDEHDRGRTGDPWGTLDPDARARLARRKPMPTVAFYVDPAAPPWPA